MLIHEILNKLSSLNESKSTNQTVDGEETYNGDEFFESYGIMSYDEDNQLNEAEYQGRKVQLNKPMRGDVKKFKVYVKKPNEIGRAHV